MLETGGRWQIRRSALLTWLQRVGGSGLPEAAAAAAFLVYVEAFPREPERTTWAFATDLVLCLTAGAVGRWPRLGATCVLLALALRAWLSIAGDPSSISLAVFTLLIPVVSLGARGHNQLRNVAAFSYLILACTITIPLDAGGSILETVALWSALMALAWAAGQTVFRLRSEGLRQAEMRTESLRSQRRSIARDLHDTVSYATTTMIMRAEQIKLRTHDAQLVDDLDFIITTGRRSVRDLRGMMEALRRNDPGLDNDEASMWRLITVSDVLIERRAELARHGILLQQSVTTASGEEATAALDDLPGSVREALGKLIVEATSNMVKHAGRGSVELIIEVHPDYVEAVFTNPIAAGEPAPAGQGLGLMGARERIEAVGGELVVNAASGTWIVRAQLPIGE